MDTSPRVPQGPAEPAVAVVIPNWNGAPVLEQCLDSLRRSTFRDFEMIVVDNGSSDSSLSVVTQTAPEARVIEMGENRGFAAAVNAGIRASTAPLIALLNNDAFPEPSWLSELVAAARARPDIATFGSLMLRADDPSLVDAAGDYFDLRWGHSGSLGAGQSIEAIPLDPYRVFGACAGAALYRRSLFDAIGLFDEDFFLTFEDTDLSMRAQLRGFDSIVVPSAKVLHVRGWSTARSAELKELFYRNRIWVMVKSLPGRDLWRVLLSHVWQNVLHAEEPRRARLLYPLRVIKHGLTGYRRRDPASTPRDVTRRAMLRVGSRTRPAGPPPHAAHSSIG